MHIAKILPLRMSVLRLASCRITSIYQIHRIFDEARNECIVIQCKLTRNGGGCNGLDKFKDFTPVLVCKDRVKSSLRSFSALIEIRSSTQAYNNSGNPLGAPLLHTRSLLLDMDKIWHGISATKYIGRNSSVSYRFIVTSMFR